MQPSGLENGSADDMIVGLQVHFDLQTNRRNAKDKAANVVIYTQTRHANESQWKRGLEGPLPIFEFGQMPASHRVLT